MDEPSSCAAACTDRHSSVGEGPAATATAPEIGTAEAASTAATTATAPEAGTGEAASTPPFIGIGQQARRPDRWAADDTIDWDDL